MKRTAVITQPTYLPWLGYFEQMRRADVFVFLDSVQFERRSWQCRNRIKDTQGEPMWLTVPLRHQPRETAIRDVLISTDRADWAEEHLRTMTSHLGRAPFFEEVHDVVRPVLERAPAGLAELNIALIRAFATRLGLAPTILCSSEIGVGGSRAELIVNLLKHLGATDYYSAAGSAEYLDQAADLFATTEISYSYQRWPHPVYEQGSTAFVSHLSVVDVLSWVGFERAAAMLDAGNEATVETVFAHAG